jgi:hypothetical protein
MADLVRRREFERQHDSDLGPDVVDVSPQIRQPSIPPTSEAASSEQGPISPRNT